MQVWGVPSLHIFVVTHCFIEIHVNFQPTNQVRLAFPLYFLAISWFEDADFKIMMVQSEEADVQTTSPKQMVSCNTHDRVQDALRALL